MNTFKIRSSSWVLFVLALVVLIFSGVVGLTSLFGPRENIVLAIAISIIALGLAFYLSVFISTALLEISITEQYIQIRWLKHILFHREKEQIIHWNEIISFKYQPDKNFDLLKIRKSDGRVFRIWHFNWLAKDDFFKLVTAVTKRIEAYNKGQRLPGNRIGKEKTIYETQLGLLLALVMGLALVAFPFLLYFFPSKSGTGWMGYLAGFAGGLYFIGQVIQNRRRKI